MVIGYDFSFPSFNKVYKYVIPEDDFFLKKTDMSDNIVEQYKEIEVEDNEFTKNLTIENKGISQIFNSSMICSGFLYDINTIEKYNIMAPSLKVWIQNNIIQLLYDISYSAAIKFDSGGNPLGIIYTLAYTPNQESSAGPADLETLNTFFQRIENITGREITNYITSHYDQTKNYQFFVNVSDRLLGVVFFDI